MQPAKAATLTNLFINESSNNHKCIWIGEKSTVNFSLRVVNCCCFFTPLPFFCSKKDFYETVCWFGASNRCILGQGGSHVKKNL